MPRLCCVPECKSNYKSSTPTDGLISTFKFPPEPILRQKWIKAISRENFTPSETSVVCAKHFSDNLIVREDSVVRSDGTVLTFLRERPKLQPNAVPHIFENQPKYRTTVLAKQRKDPADRMKEQAQRNDAIALQRLKEDVILNFAAFKENFCNKIDLSAIDFHFISSQDDVLFYKLEVNGCPKISLSLKVLSDMSLEIWKEGILLPSSMIKSFLNQQLIMEKWSKCKELFVYLKSLPTNFISKTDKLKFCAQLLNECAENHLGDDETKVTGLFFLSEQIDLLCKQCPKYSAETIVIAYSLFLHNASSYSRLRNMNILCLPHPSYLKKFSAKLGTEKSGLLNSHLKYLSDKATLLNDSEKIVSLLLDEIYIKPAFSYKGGAIEGIAHNALQENNSTVVHASTIQAFMISSVFCQSKDVVALFPVKNITGDQLYDMIVKVLEQITDIGFTVISMISDNNGVNRNAFIKLGNGTLKCSIKNPFDPNKSIFILFDTVHLFKSIRNNWFNQTDDHQTFFVPAFEEHEKVLQANVHNLKQLYLKESKQIVKLAPTLNKKVLFPTSIERQKVLLVTKLFNDTNIVALKNAQLPDVEGTIEFLNIILHWWKIVNVKHYLKGRNLRDEFCDPIKSSDCRNLVFLRKFICWLESWNLLHISGQSKQKRFGKLSVETHEALLHTTKAICELCEYVFETQKIKFLLLGKFQTDNLENRFGNYRQMSGGNYDISVRQVLESEKRLKLLSYVKLTSSKLGNFAIKECLHKCSEFAVDDRLDRNIDEFFSAVLDLSNDVTIPEDQRMALVFISGYVSHSVSKQLKCKNCKAFLSLDKLMQIDHSTVDVYKYLSESSRGGLKWPTDFVLEIAMIAYRIFTILISTEFEEAFLNCKNQWALFKKLCIEKWENDSLIASESCDCKAPVEILIQKSVSILGNIFLNNYCKLKNDMKPATVSKGKKRKLNTLLDKKL